MSGRYEQLSTTADEGTSTNLEDLATSSCHSGLSLQSDGNLPTRQVLSCIKITSRGLSSNAEKYKSCTVEDASILGQSSSGKQESKSHSRLSNDFSIIENPVSDLSSSRYLKPELQHCALNSHDEHNCSSQLKEKGYQMHIIEGDDKQAENVPLQCMHELEDKISCGNSSPKMRPRVSQSDILQSSNSECSPCSRSETMAIHAPHSIKTSSVYLNTNEINSIPQSNYNQNKPLLGLDLNEAVPEELSSIYQNFPETCNNLRSYTDEHANIQANLLAHFDSYSDYVFKPPTSESPVLKSYNGRNLSGSKVLFSSQQRSNSESSPCITDVDGNTSFKVGISNSNVGEKSKSSKKKGYGWRDSNSKSFDKASSNSKSEVVPKLIEGKCDKTRNIIPLVRSKSLSASKGNADEVGGRMQRTFSTGSEGSVGTSLADDKQGLAHFISRQLLSWRRQDNNVDEKLSDVASAATTTDSNVAKASHATSRKDQAPQVQPSTAMAAPPKTANNISASLVRNVQISNSRRSASYSVLKSESPTISTNSTPNSPRKVSGNKNSLQRNGAPSMSSLSINSSPSHEENTGNASSWWLLGKLGFRKNSKSAAACQPQAGTAGLIMESRPAHLPAKSHQERLLHQQQHEQLLQQSRRKEQQLQEQQRRQQQMKLQQEAQMAEAVAVWTDEILSDFAAKRDTKKCRELWWRGLPPSVRGKIWGLAIGNALNVSPHLYDLLQERTNADQQQQLQKVVNGVSENCTSSTELQSNHLCISDHREVAGWRRSPSQSFIPQYHIAPGHCEPAVVPPSPLVRCRLPEAVDCIDCFQDPEDSGYSNASSSDTSCSLVGTSWFQVAQSVDCITLDVSRTFPQLGIFQQGGPYHANLHRLLQSYVRCRPDIGYVQGMSFLAATLLLNMPERDAFIAFANLLSKPLLQAFYSLHEKKMVAYYRTHSSLVAALLPTLHTHLQKLQVTPDLYLLDWVLSLFTRSLPLDVASRIWDIFTRDGDEFFFRAACGESVVPWWAACGESVVPWWAACGESVVPWWAVCGESVVPWWAVCGESVVPWWAVSGESGVPWWAVCGESVVHWWTVCGESVVPW
ncbi:Rab-GTPase-TBC domain [Trinorchestia longiramus]|nr:Rab-GTPase-TBC domain [Trinorchestia longiramus]